MSRDVSPSTSLNQSYRSLSSPIVSLVSPVPAPVMASNTFSDDHHQRADPTTAQFLPLWEALPFVRQLFDSNRYIAIKGTDVHDDMVGNLNYRMHNRGCA